MQEFFTSLEQVQLGDEVKRLFHGRGGRYPGCEHLCLDWFPPVMLLTSFQELNTEARNELTQWISAQWPIWCQQSRYENPELNLVYQYRSGSQTQTDIVCGEVPDQHWVKENGLKFNVHLPRGQNHGLFLDMCYGRKWVQQHAQNKSVLNLFAYTCGFSVAALSGGATGVINIDMSKGALSVGKQNHVANGFAENARFFGHDIFKSWGKLKKFGPYDLVIADPPSNQKGSFVATKDYVRLLRRLPDLVAQGGEVLLCLNAPQLDSQFLKQQVADAAPQLEFVERIANPEIFADIDEEKSLKVLRYRLK
ncbi:class I SAM-dependent methyltransferase [Shewanella gelidii]|uniref:S-adenosylmethionine-dependent methyltransferase n=1 Tax=Shewanella gelidii TaxID=1642821 RepID=A0A917JTF3_9GAMM|nr:class I SAM-dependent methyltransferase [Shewanella gelidii]MCL1098287.1 class I SAM-dependent methyltransferase [Shewanella gelidii]GGI84100.1 S-adenosylmethionine-dependent methyltransferase [Shewanella gelidii]